MGLLNQRLGYEEVPPNQKEHQNENILYKTEVQKEDDLQDYED